jgi:hypothetical protein
VGSSALSLSVPPTGTGNESFILAYGFVPIPNPHDEVVLRLGGGQEPGGAGNTDLAALLSSHDLDISERHVVPMDGTIPPRLWQSVRVVVGAGGAGGVAGGNDERGDVETEMDTADEVARMLESKIQGIERAVRGWRDGGVDVADGGGIRKGVYEMCGVYLQGAFRSRGGDHRRMGKSRLMAGYAPQVN